jgi:hypothetical protein
MLGRLVKELIRVPKFLFLASQIKASADEFSKNNFNIK